MSLDLIVSLASTQLHKSS